MRGLLFGIFALSLLHSGLGCAGGGGPAPPPDEETTTAAPEETTTQEAETTTKEETCADDLDLKPYGKTGYKNGGPVEEAKKLSFDASKTGGSCWENHQPPADKLEFVKTKEGKKLQKCKKGDPAPKGGEHIVVYTPDAVQGDALFHSCSILCSDGPPKVTVDGGKSKDVKMEICTSDSFSKPKPKNCKPVKFGKPVKIGNEKRPTIYDIVIRAKGFKENSYAAIKKIKVDFKKCADDAAAGDGICKAACEFGSNTCGWGKDQANTAATEFKAYEKQTIVGNLDSGVNARLDGNPSATYPISSDSGFLAAPQNPGDLDVASIEIEETKEDYEMTADVYDACDGNAAKICFDTITNCPYTSNPSVAAADRQWQKASVPVPKGTKKILLVGDNSAGQRFCATGFGHVNFKKAGGGGAADDAPLCKIADPAAAPQPQP